MPAFLGLSPLKYGLVATWFSLAGASQQWLEGLHSKRENWYKICYQLVPGTFLMVILGSIGTKVFKKDVLVYGFPLLEYGSPFLE